MSAIHYTECPVCGSKAIHAVFAVKDYTVSGKLFSIFECSDCSLRFTQDIPSAEEIGAYYKSEDYISHTNSSKGFINQLYQSARKKTLVKKEKLVKQLTGLEKGDLLDIGTGIGAFPQHMKTAGWSVTALEPDEGAREKGKQLFGLDIRPQEDFFQLGAAGFDAITLWHVLEHVHDLHRYVEQFKYLLKPAGKLFVAVPNYTSKDARHYKEYWAAYDVPRHLYHFSPESMNVLMNKHGLKIEEHLPMWYDSFYVSMLSNRYKKGKTDLVGAFINGLGSNIKAIGNKQKCSSVIYVISRPPVTD